jgi:uncharacterized protein YqhQ
LNSKTHRTTIGGQAIIEGIMMLGPEAAVATVRTPDGLMASKELPPRKKRGKFHPLKWLFIRGVYNLGATLKLGYSALDYSASFIEDDAEPEGKIDRWLAKFDAQTVQKAVMSVAMVLTVLLAVGLFILTPTLVVGWVQRFLPQPWMRNVAEGSVRLLILLCYMASMSLMKDIRRVFAYHGAEHKAIACYEAGQDLTLENVRQKSRRHPRCGTSFLLVVVIVSILVFSFISWDNQWVRFGLRLALLPVVVGVSYEINRLVGRYDNILTRIIRAPGLWLQGITTREPDDSMIEVGIEALKAVLPEEHGADKW